MTAVLQILYDVQMNNWESENLGVFLQLNSKFLELHSKTTKDRDSFLKCKKYYWWKNLNDSRQLVWRSPRLQKPYNPESIQQDLIYTLYKAKISLAAAKLKPLASAATEVCSKAQFSVLRRWRISGLWLCQTSCIEPF